MEWKNVEKSYGSDICAFTGKYPIFIIFYDVCTDDKTKKYKLKCNLPGIKENLGNFTDVEGAKDKAEHVFIYWLKNSELIQINEQQSEEVLDCLQD